MAPRVALVTPYGPSSARGNAITVARIARGLAGHGLDVAVWDFETSSPEAVAAGIEAFRPALVHAFHAFNTGPAALHIARRLEVPLVLTLTGTDANIDLLDAGRAATVRAVLEASAAVVVFHDSLGEHVGALMPDVRPKLVVIPQGVAFAAVEPFDLAARCPALPRDAVTFLLPAGIRPVKRPRLPLAPLGDLVARVPHVRLLYAGPVLDRAEGEALAQALAQAPWAHHLGVVLHGQMASLIEQVSVVLNCSASEGGMANSILEALSLGRAVLAADIPGNRSLVEPEVTGLLFGDERQLREQAERLVRDPCLRARLGAEGRALVGRRYPAGREIERHLAVYRRLSPVPVA